MTVEATIDPDGLRWATDRLAPLGLDRNGVAEVWARWRELEDPIAELHQRGAGHEAGPLDFLGWLQRFTAAATDEGA